MKIPDKVKFLMVLCSGLIFFISGCVDTSVQTIPSQIVYHSDVQFTNLVAGAGTATLKLNDQSIGDVGFGEESSNMTVQAGSKTLKIDYANLPDTTMQYLFNTEVDRKFRIFLLGTTTSSYVMKSDQRYIFQTPDIPSDSALVTFFNGSPADTVIGMAISGPQTANVGTALAPGDFSSTMSFVPGDYSVEVTSVNVDTMTTTFNYSVAAAHKYTAAVYDSQPNLKFKPFIDD